MIPDPLNLFMSNNSSQISATGSKKHARITLDGLSFTFAWPDPNSNHKRKQKLKAQKLNADTTKGHESSFNLKISSLLIISGVNPK